MSACVQSITQILTIFAWLITVLHVARHKQSYRNGRMS